MKIALIGYGKMGHIIESIAHQRGHEIVCIIDQNNTQYFTSEAFASADVAIEFTTPTTAYTNVRTCIECGTPVVSGTTGWHDKLEKLQALCREKNSTMIWSSNYSLGVNITFRLNRYLAELMNRFDGYNIAIEEIHHTQKKDAPPIHDYKNSHNNIILQLFKAFFRERQTQMSLTCQKQCLIQVLKNQYQVPLIHCLNAQTR